MGGLDADNLQLRREVFDVESSQFGAALPIYACKGDFLKLLCRCARLFVFSGLGLWG